MSRLRGQLIPLGAVLALLGLWAAFELQSGGTNSAESPKKADGRLEYAATSADGLAAQPAPFDGKRSLDYVRELCTIGTRISGSEGMKKQQDLLKAHFEKLGAKVAFQRFTARQTTRPNPVDMANIIVTWHPERERRILLCSHYDTRPRADQEANPRRWDEPFLSANDGTSGVAWMMELAHSLPKLPLSVGVDFVLFDGEEYVFDGPQGQDKYFLGSEHFAAEYRRTPPKHRYVGAVLLDLFAGKDAKYPIEQNSRFHAGSLVQDIWRTAAELKVNSFQNRRGPIVNDDHLALNKIGIPAVDIIDFDYPHWHKLSDSPDKCSADSMDQLARVLTVWLQRVR